MGADGSVRWSFHPADYGSYPYGPAFGADGTVYIAFGPGLYALNDSGRQLWLGQSDAGEPSAAPVIGPDGTIYVWTVQGRLLAFSGSGSLRWSYLPQRYVSGNGWLALGPDSTVYVACEQMLSAVNGDGTGRWQFGGGEYWGISGPPAIATDGSVYVQLGESLYVLAPEDGHVLRSNPMHLTCSQPAPALAADGSCYVSGYGVEAIGPAGEALWQLDVDMPYYGWSQALLADSLLCVAGDGRAFAVKTGGGPAQSYWPMYQHDPQRTGRAR